MSHEIYYIFSSLPPYNRSPYSNNRESFNSEMGEGKEEIGEIVLPLGFCMLSQL